MNSAPDEKAFDYSALDQETAAVVKACTKTIQSRPLTSAERMIEVGQQLQITKERLKHGQFSSWLELELGMNSRQARRLMRVAKQIKTDKKDDSSFLSVLEISPSALYLLAEIKTPSSARDEAIDRATLGEIITLRVAKAIVSRHKEQDPHLSENLALPIIDIPDILNKPTIFNSHTESLEAITPKFCVGDHVRILRRQNGADKWTGCTAKVWEVTPNGWLRVDVEGYKGVKFTLNPNWIELLAELNMTEPTIPQSFSDPDPVIPEKPLPVRIPLEIEGKTIEIDGIINEVEVHYTHQGIAGTIMLPANRVIFSEA